MKTKCLFVLAAILVGSQWADAQTPGTAFTYQGRLIVGTNLANGSYDLRFYLRDALTAGNAVGTTNTLSSVAVSNGLFSVMLDFSNQFFGASRWLEIGVRTNGSVSAYTTLAPRQQLTPTPYAMYSTTAGNASSFTSILAGDVTGTEFATAVSTIGGQTAGNIASGANSANLATDQNIPSRIVNRDASGNFSAGLVTASFSGNGSGIGSLNAANLSSGTLADARLSANVALRNAGQTFTAINTFSNLLGAPGGIHLYDTNLWLRNDNNHGLGWYGAPRKFAGTNVDGPVLFGWNGGALGVKQDAFEQLALTWNNNSVVMSGALAVDDAGLNNGTLNRGLTFGSSSGEGIASKRTSGGNQSGLDFYTAGNPRLSIFNNGGVVMNGPLALDDVNSNNGTLNPGLTFGSSSGEGIASKRTSGGNQYNLEFYTAGNPCLSILNGGNIGIGNQSPQSKLDVNGQVRAQGIFSSGDSPLGSKFAFAGNYTEGTFSNWNGTGNNAACRRLLGAEDYHCGFGEAFGVGIASPVVWMYESSGNAFEVRKVGYNVQVPNGQKLFAVHSDGTTEVQVLEITGGSDLAEPFHVSDADIPKGALVIIDEENPGQLKLSSEPYDHRVAGIISGANGINPGLTLHQQGKLEGGKNVALSGRVYALADATHEVIKPGDLLTSSSIPGHLMKASDYSRAHGAIVGKAMSSLKTGKGMVLVLVSLQ